MKFKIKTNLVTGIVMGLLSIFLLVVMPKQVRVPAFDSGAPSPRIIPGVCIVIMLVCSVILVIQSLVFKKEKIVEFDWQNEKPAILLIALLCIYVFLIIKLGFIIASAITFIIVLFYSGERKPFIYIFTIALAIGIYFLFSKVFHVSLPSGILPF
ncbi:MAG: tripartite tricarboxylate transporter TctB family protein [Oscillospiraceae bacterium]|nr:tripartite tricarboxylate transporter TctB family protein [Oscillospiraceae bacterium]MBR4552072.1 tripartite tricarboxylate transporter TctB family protein [Oscillospiraceae bacterium]